LLPTGNVIDKVEGHEVTLVDNGMPVIVLQAADLRVSGHESCEELEANSDLRRTLERIRLAAGPMMNLGDVGGATVPKLTMVSPPQSGGAVSTRTFIPHRCHQAIGVLGAVSVATACLLPGSPASALANLPPDAEVVRLEHPSGSFDAWVRLHHNGGPRVEKAGIIRTARKLMDGMVFPRS
jgi:4-oxalomesaconate tautomerase